MPALLQISHSGKWLVYQDNIGNVSNSFGLSALFFFFSFNMERWDEGHEHKKKFSSSLGGKMKEKKRLSFCWHD